MTEKDNQKKHLLLEGIRVIDFSMWFAGPMATRLLADMGAQVIKIESLTHIDPWRGAVSPDRLRALYPELNIPDQPYNSIPGFNLQNRNKYGITLDLAQNKGKEIIKKLVRISDVVLENYSPRVMPKLGLDYKVLKGIKSDIIMMSLPALGKTGPYKNYLAFGQTIDCMSGMAYLTGYEGEEPMLQSGLSYGDPLSGMNAAFAVVSALLYRRRNGSGLHIDLSQVEGLVAFNADSILDYTMNGRIRERIGNRDRAMAPQGCYRCRGEDMWVVITIPDDAAWQRFGEAIGNPSWASDAKYSDVNGRKQYEVEMDTLIEEWTKQWDKYEVMRIMQNADVPSGPALDARELLDEPHLQERGFFEMVEHPVAGTHPYIGAYAKFSKTPVSIRKPAPCLGEDNHYVFGELLGMSEEEIEELEELGITGTIPKQSQQGGMY